MIDQKQPENVVYFKYLDSIAPICGNVLDASKNTTRNN
jgi:hypothetical protein